MTPARKYVAYYRVSTQRQGQSGLGLEAQQRAVEDFGARTGARIIKTFREVESGKRTDTHRPELQRALQACRAYGATLLVAKFDRLARNAAFLLRLKEGSVPIIAADMPEINEGFVGIMAVVAQMERKMISDRTKAALAAAKRRGVTRDGRPLRLGNPDGLSQHHQRRGRTMGRTVRTEKARAWAEDKRDILAEIQGSGITTVRGIARELNALEVPAPRGGQWAPVQVSRLLQRLSV